MRNPTAFVRSIHVSKTYREQSLMKRYRKMNPQRIVGAILFVSLVLSVVYAFAHFLQAPDTAPEGMPHTKVRSDYLLMLTQCILGLAVMLLPSMINRKWSVPISRKIYIAYYIFLFCAIFLGEVHDFYYMIPCWDLILHAFSGAMLSALGFMMVDLLNMNQKVSVRLSPFFESVFAFCFALALGSIWEIYEFIGDAILGLNMQKACLADGTLLVGRAALMDTMEDLIIDTVAAAVVALAGYQVNKRKTAAEETKRIENPKAC